MQEPTDDQLDGLFRKSAEEFNVPFDPAAWQALKTRMDTRDRLTVWEHLLRWGLPALLLLFLIVGSWNAYRKQTIATQSVESGMATRQLRPTNTTLALGESIELRNHPAGNNPTEPNETTPVSTKSTRLSQPAVGQPDASKQPTLRADANEPVRLVPNANEAVAPLATKRSRPNPPEVLNPTTRPGKLTAPVERVSPVVSARSPSRSPSATARLSARGRTGGSWVLTGGQKQTRRLIGRRAKEPVVVSSPETNYTGEPVRSFPKRQLAAQATGRKMANKLQADIGSPSADGAVSAQRFSVGASDRIGSEPTTDTAIPAPTVVPSFDELTNRPGQWPKPLSFTSRDVTAPLNPAQTEQPVSVQPVVPQKGLSVRFMVSPDLSTIGLRNFQRPGTNVGLLLEYRLASRWSVQAGVIQSTKVYKTSQYELDSYLAGQKLIPESVSGRCNMFDIPINLRYDIALRPRLNSQAPSRWFVSGGVTTYIMKKEDYVYNYSEADRPHVYPSTPKAWSTSTGRYNFSQLNLSVGYERSISRRLSWQVEPFVKAPLKSVGYYKINLLSTGAFFSLRYKL